MLPRADYLAFDRLVFIPSQLKLAGPWDLFLSAYDETVRVQRPFNEISARRKQWIVHEEYEIAQKDWPQGAVEIRGAFDSPAILDFVADNIDQLRNGRLCIDATGFIRPHLLILLWGLKNIGVQSFDVLYSDPIRYVDDEQTFFAGPINEVAQVPGYAGVHHVSPKSNDVLVVGAGYDFEQITSVCEAKRSSKKFVLIGLPSLQPHMYQESVIRIHRATEWIGSLPPQRYLYASANHPFTVAQTLRDLVYKEDQSSQDRGKLDENVYFCPVGPKPHVLGFAIYYLRELIGSSASIVYPFANRYTSTTTQGLSRTWQYRIEL